MVEQSKFEEHKERNVFLRFCLVFKFDVVAIFWFFFFSSLTDIQEANSNKLKPIAPEIGRLHQLLLQR